MAMSGVFFTQDVSSRVQRARSPPTSPTSPALQTRNAGAVCRRRPCGALSSREVVSRVGFGSPQSPPAGNRSARSPPPPSKEAAASPSSSIADGSRPLLPFTRAQPRAAPRGSPSSDAREEATVETLRAVESALKGVQIALKRSEAASKALVAGQSSAAKPAAFAPAPRSFSCNDAMDFAAVAEAAARAVSAASAVTSNAKAAGSGSVLRPRKISLMGSPGVEAASPSNGVIRTVSSLAAARESHKARVNALDRSVRFTNGLLEKIEGLRDGIGSSCSDTSTTGPESSCGSVRDDYSAISRVSSNTSLWA